MKNLVFNLRTAKAQAGCAKLKDTSLSFRRGLGRGFLFTFLLLTLGVGQMWAGRRVYCYGKTTAPNIYIWNSGTSSDNSSSWDQQRDMTLVEGTTDLWYFDLTTTGKFKCIFRDKDKNKYHKNDIEVTQDNMAYNLPGSGSDASGNQIFLYTEDAVLYFKMSSWWTNDGSPTCQTLTFAKYNGDNTSRIPINRLQKYLDNNSDDLDNTTKGENNLEMFATIPAGAYRYSMTYYRGNSNSTQWNTGTITSFDIAKNKDNTAIASNSHTPSWTTYKPTSTGSVVADETDVLTNTAVTLTPSLTSNLLLNKYKSVVYSVSPGTSGTDWTIAGNTFTPKVAGTYTITATITYYAKGFPSLTSTVAPTVTITASNPAADYTVTYDVHSSGHGSLAATYTTGGASIGASPATVTSGSGLTFTASPNSYYKVEAWYTNAACNAGTHDAGETTYSVASLSSDLNVYVKFEPITYSITYHLNGGTNHVSNPSSYNYTTSTITLQAPTKTGYTFGGWYDNSSFTGSAVTTIPNHSNGNKEYWAKWTINSYNITYSPASAPTGATYTTTPSSANYNSTVDVVVTPTAASYLIQVTAVDAGSNTVTVTNPSANTYRFTMPASNVTVTVTATALPIVYVLKTKHASSSLGDGATGFPSDGKIWAWKAGGSENFYNGATWAGPTASSKATVITDDIIGDEWYRFIPDNTSYFDGSTEYHVILTSTNRILNTETTFIENGSSHSAATHTGTIWIVPHGTNANTAYLYTSYPDMIATPYNVTYNAGDHGDLNVFGTSVTSGNSQTISTTRNRTLTASPASGYAFNRWITTGSVTVADATSATTMVTATGTGTVTATYFEEVDSGWYIQGNINEVGWYQPETLPLNRLLPGETNVYYRPVTLPGDDRYFRFWHYEGGVKHDYSHGGGTDCTVTKGTKYNISKDKQDAFKYSVGGTVWFVVDESAKKCWLQDPVEFYSVNFGYSDGCKTFSAKDGEGNDLVSGNTYLAGTALTFTQTPRTGYNFVGWNTAADGSGDELGTGSSYSVASLSADVNVYAIYEPKTTNITLSQTGAATTGSVTSRTGTYDAAMPAISGANTLPVAQQGYAFMGYYDALEPLGTQYYNADGTSAHIWDKTDATATLYAYFKKAEITGITFSPAAAEPDEEVTATATISPTPTGTTMVCWEVRYASNNVLLDPQPTFDPENGASVTFTAPSAAVYKFTATLKTGSDCAAGTILDTENANLTVAGSHPVTIRYKHGDVVIKEETIQNIHATVATEISAPNIIGYSFSSWTLGDGITKVSGNLTDPSITVTAIYDGVITANYNTKRMIYFYNTLGWSSVNVYFYKNDTYWNNTNGTGANTGYTFTNTPYSEGKHGAMTNITGTNIWYFDAEGAGVNASYDDVVFTELDQHGYGYFAKTDDKQNKVVRRGDYKSSMPMFVPVEQDGVSLNGGLAIYYNEGYWMNYPENTGYTVRIYNAWNVDMTSPAREYYFPYSSDKKMPLKLDVEFNTTDAKWFSIYRNDGVYLGVNALMTQASHTNYRIKDSNNKIKIQPSAPGIYTYTLTFYDDGEKDGSGKAYGNMYHITVDYPVSVGDFRILYSDNAEWSQGWAHNSVGHAWCHPSDAINKISAEATEAKKDTVSLFVSYGASPTAKFQYVSAINPSTGAVTWSDVDGGTISLSSITKSGTYNFIISQPVGGASVSVEKIEAYTGNYYIRTDCAGNTKWDSYRAADHQMTYSEFSCSEANSFGEKFSHYFTHWCPAGMNVKFVIANDYSSCISDTLIQDVGNIYNNINSDGFLNSDGNPEETANRFSANIRFMYNEATNKISRAYVASSTNASRLFLVLRGNEVIKDENGTAVNDQGVTNGAILSDKENWIYEKTLKILPGSKFKLFACYAEVTPSQSGAQYFRGYWAEDDWANSANTIELVGGSGSYQKVRVLYDFKTNRLVCAWLPDGDVTGEMNINADVMIIREHQEDATMITFTNSSSKLEGVKTVYGAMKFNRWILNNKSTETGHAVLPVANQKSIFERALYFISFPFDVNLGEVFGFGTYGVHWIIENYDGENRAKNGYWIDSPPNWKYVTSPKGYTLKANKGYILCLDLDLMKDDNEEFWPHGIETVELFFPSAVMQSTIEQAEVTIPAPDPAIYQCTINRGTPEGDRTIKDSYWRCLGVPSFANYTTTLSNGTSTITWQTGSTLPYLYAWNMENNTLTAQGTSTFAFKTMHAYLTQCSTAIVWTAASKPTPAAIARYSENDMLKDREFRLELVENGVKADQTYIRLSAKEDVTSGFEFGNDLSKELNSGVSNIYTFIGYERAAANSLPLSDEQITIVPVGVVANAAGEYTFSMPDGTDGIGVTLIDEETGIRTSLSALDYTITLDKGTYDSRFWLEISPVKGAETGIDPGVDARENGVRKVMIDGILYIIRDGKMYDARGARVE